MKFNRTDSTYLLLLILFSVCILFSWFYKGNLFIGAEEGIIFQRIDIVYEKMVSRVWLDLYLGIPYFSDLSKRPFYAVLSFLFYQGVPPFFLQVLTFGIILSGSVISIYLLLRETLKQVPFYRLAAFSGALFYLSNPYAISQIWGRGLYPQFFAYLYYPVFLLFIAHYFNSQRKIFLLFNLLFSFALSAAMGNPSYFVSLWILASVYWVFRSAEYGWFSKKFSYQLLVCAIFFFCWLGINSWWLAVTLLYAPAAFLGEGNIFENSLTSLRAISNQYNLFSLLRLYHPLHFESQLYFGLYLFFGFQILSWISFVVVLFGIKYLKSRNLWFYLCLFIVGLFVCLGSNYPFGKVFEWFFVNFPPLQVFRNPYEKFGLVYLLAYSALFGVGIVTILTIIRKWNYSIARFSVAVVLIITVLVFNWPLWTGDVISWGNQVGIPSYYQQLDDWQKKNSSNSRIIFTPFLSSFGASYKWLGSDYHGNDPIYQMIDASVITQTGTNSYLSALKQYMGSKDLFPALKRIQVGYIVDRPDLNSTTSDKKSLSFLTQYYLESTEEQVSLCSKIVYESDHFSCDISPLQKDLSQFQIIKIVMQANSPGYLEIAMLDNNNIQPRWVGEKNPQLQYHQNEINQEKTALVYLFNPTENPNTNFNVIENIKIYFRSGSNLKDDDVQIKKIYAVRGNKVPIKGISYLFNIGSLPIFKLNNNSNPDMVRSYSKVEYVDSYDQLFDSFAQSDTTAFMIKSQNSSKKVLPEQFFDTDINHTALSISETLITLPKKGTYFIGNNQNFNPEWKVVHKDLSQNDTFRYFQKLKWYFQNTISEENHYLIDGFANGWVVSTNSPSKVVLFYRPQLLMDILWPISVIGFLLLTFYTLFTYFKDKNKGL